MRRRIRTTAYIALAIGLPLLAACSAVSSIFSRDTKPSVKLDRLEIVAEPSANQNSATALDIVFAYDASMLGLLPKTGPEWFAQKAALLRTFPQTLDVVSLEIPPAYTTRAPLPKRRNTATRALVYANYLAEAGQAALDVTESAYAIIRLKPAAIEAATK